MNFKKIYTILLIAIFTIFSSYLIVAGTFGPNSDIPQAFEIPIKVLDASGSTPEDDYYLTNISLYDDFGDTQPFYSRNENLFYDDGVSYINISTPHQMENDTYYTVGWNLQGESAKQNMTAVPFAYQAIGANEYLKFVASNHTGSNQPADLLRLTIPAGTVNQGVIVEALVQSEWVCANANGLANITLLDLKGNILQFVKIRYSEVTNSNNLDMSTSILHYNSTMDFTLDQTFIVNRSAETSCTVAYEGLSMIITGW